MGEEDAITPVLGPCLLVIKVLAGGNLVDDDRFGNTHLAPTLRLSSGATRTGSLEPYVVISITGSCKAWGKVREPGCSRHSVHSARAQESAQSLRTTSIRGATDPVAWDQELVL